MWGHGWVPSGRPGGCNNANRPNPLTLAVTISSQGPSGSGPSLASSSPSSTEAVAASTSSDPSDASSSGAAPWGSTFIATK